MTIKLNPNQAFKYRNKRSQPVYKATVVIRCGCGWKTIVSRVKWLGEEEITCHNCGSEHSWDVL